MEKHGETELNSFILFRFRLQNRVDENDFEMYLNPIQGNQGVHHNFNYGIIPLLTRKDDIFFIILNSIPRNTKEHFGLACDEIVKGLGSVTIALPNF